jgi:hypothetical protein
MADQPQFLNAWPYAKDVRALPVANIDDAAAWMNKTGKSYRCFSLLRQTASVTTFTNR